MVDTISQVNQGIVNSFTNVNVLNAVGWLIFGIICLSAFAYGYYWYTDARRFKKKITAFDIVNDSFVPSIRDKAKTVKLGKGGFEILYLRKQKTWKLAYGGRVGRDTYYFFIMPDGYWYNGMLSANINRIKEDKGLVPIVTTNPTMRSQYTSLEKQIDSLHKDKVNLWEKYGSTLISIAFLIIAGIFLWLNYKQFVVATANLNNAINNVAELIKQVNNLMANAQVTSSGGSGLVPA